MFEPVSTYRVVRTYAMDWIEFEANTTAVREAGRGAAGEGE
jgi:hypothetical protein